jgi:predicted site-specific integrase-resolvase
MKLSTWAEKQGISYKTAWRWWKNGKLPVPGRQLPSGTILVDEEPTVKANCECVIYARVSSSDQKDDLDRQVERLQTFASARGLVVTDIVKEIGSGLNGRRKKLKKLLSDPHQSLILVEHKDRLTQFGFDFISAALNANKRQIIVADETEKTADLWQDFVDVVTCMCARLYGRRGAKNRAEKALQAAQQGEGK